MIEPLAPRQRKNVVEELDRAFPRVIGRYSGKEKGPLLICFGGMHGNELAGVKALEIMFDKLAVEPHTNPSFVFRGRMLGLRGNRKAMKFNKRFLVKDLNRQWTNENVHRIKNCLLYTSPSPRDS